MTFQAVMREAENLNPVRSLPPQVKEMLTDPIVCALMIADSVDPDALEAMLFAVACRLRASALQQENGIVNLPTPFQPNACSSTK